MSKIKSAYWNVIDGGDYELKPKKHENQASQHQQHQQHQQYQQYQQHQQALQAFKAASSYQRTNELRNKLKARFNGLAEADAKVAD